MILCWSLNMSGFIFFSFKMRIIEQMVSEVFLSGSFFF